LRAALTSARLWIVSLPYFCIVIAFYGISFWLPQIVQASSGYSSAMVVLLSAIPYVSATIGIILIGSHSDRTGERHWHVAIPCLIGAVGFLLTVLAPASPAYALATLSIAAFGIWGTLGPYWTLPTAFLRGTAAAGGIAVVNSVGNIGGFVGPFLVGWVRDATGGFAAGLLILAAFLVVGAVITLRLQQAK
jgi:nitrate/nitrite transporter NarK